MLSVTEWQPRSELGRQRARKAEQVIVDAALILDDADRRATKVPGRVLLPLLQAASVEEDTDLRRMWATLLANSADSARGADMLPGFVSILGELAPVEALILESVYFQSQDDPNHVGYVPGDDGTILKLYAGRGQEPMREVTLPFGNYKVLVDNLARLGLIQQVFTGQTTFGLLETYRDYYSGLRLSPLGHHFVQACAVAPKA